MSEDDKMGTEPAKISTKQKILDNAIDLFASKGYTETTIRELAAAVGVKEASIYNHFTSKNAILECILEEYSKITYSIFNNEKRLMLKDNPTPDGILSCMRIVFPKGKEVFYLKSLYVILQEQHRNPIVREFVSTKIILDTERVARSIIQALIEFGILRADTDLDFWARMHSSLLYCFASRALLDIGDTKPDYTGMGMPELLWNLYDMLLRTCRV